MIVASDDYCGPWFLPARSVRRSTVIKKKSQ